MAFRYLDDDQLHEVRHAAVSMGWTTDEDLNALTTGISPAFVASSMVGPNPLAKLLTLTARMNATESVPSDQVRWADDDYDFDARPFGKWLKNAIRLAEGTEQEMVFRRALQNVEPDALPAEEAPKDYEAVPQVEGALEVTIGEDDTLGVEFLLKGALAARSVARLRVHRHFHGEPSFKTAGKPDYGFGTGWLIAPNLMITNHHVINARTGGEDDAMPADFALQACATEVDFDFVAIDAHVTTGKALSCLASDRELDYALLRLGDAPERKALRLRPNPLTHQARTPLRERVNVLQHADGEPMRLGFRDNFVVVGTGERLSYLTDTRGGSSGSPLCDDAWFVAGLHSGWTNIVGEPVTLWGKEIRQENYGTPIGRILAKLETDNPELHAEIVAGQSG